MVQRCFFKFVKCAFDMNEIGNMLNAYREERHLSQAEVADILGIPVLDYIDIEEGKAELNVSQLLLFCANFKIKPDDLLSAAITPPKPAPPERRKAKKKKTGKGGAKKALYAQYQAERESEDDETGEKRFLNLIAEVITGIVIRQTADDEKLEQFPDGYHMEERRQCPVCGDWVEGEKCWYDHLGFKCMLCQKAIDQGIIPAGIVKNEDLYYTEIRLETDFNMKRKTLKAFMKQGYLKSRVIPGPDGKGEHFQLFLVSDNETFLPPPEKLRVGGPVKEINEHGKEVVTFYPWYCFVDPVEHLKDYGISQWLRFVPVENKNKPADDENVQNDENK